MSFLSRYSPQEQRKIALGTGLLLVLVLAWGWLKPSVASWLDFAQFERSVNAKDPDPLDGYELVDVRMEALTRSVTAFEPDRNIFGFGPEPPPPPVRVQPVRREPPPPPPVAAPTVEPPREPQPPPVPFKLIGIFGPQQRRIAVLEDGEETLNAVVGEKLKDTFIVLDIGFQTVEFGFVGFPADKTARIDMGSP